MNSVASRFITTVCFLYLCLASARYTSYAQSVYAQQDVVVMLGAIVENEARIWVQTKESARVSIAYKPTGALIGAATDDHFTSPEHGNTFTFTLPHLIPDTEYEYRVNVEGVVHHSGVFLTPPALEVLDSVPDVSIVLGSCAYLFDRHLGEEDSEPQAQIFNSMAQTNPDIVLWMGDNVYLRSPDLSSYSGFVNRYTHTRNHDSVQQLLQCAPNIAIWDDHDFGANNAVGSAPYADIALQAFQTFWANPESSFGREHGSIATTYRYMDVELFLLDNRTFRQLPAAYGDSAQVFGREQIDWLKENILASFASVKIVVAGGQLLNAYNKFENHSRYPEEHKYLLQTLEQLSKQGVIIVSGDRHFSEITKHMFANGSHLYDCTVSPLTSGAWAEPTDVNPDRVEGSQVTQRNFAVLTITGNYKQRTIRIEYFDVKGKSVFSRILD